MNNFKIKNAEYVEVFVPNGNTKQTIYFPDLPNLRNRPIEGIEIYSVLEQGVTNTGYTVQAVAELVNTTVTLYFDGGEYIVVPALSLRRVDNGTNHGFFQDIPNLAGQNIVWTKSYVQLNASVASFQNKSFLFNVYYVRG